MKKSEMDIPFFSIIIPIYNTPIDNINKALNSILEQTILSYEVILVDDGSEKKCSQAIDVIQQRDSRIVVIHQENGGVSKARNSGIQKARGEYIIFVDADDEIDVNYLKSASHYIEKYSPDIIYASISYVPEVKIKQNEGSVEIFEGEDELQEINKCLLGISPRRLQYKILGTPCARVYKTKYVKKAYFEEGVPLCEDQLFNRKILKEVNKVIVVPDVWYYYIQNDFSAMHKTMRESYFKMAKPYWEALINYNKKENKEIQGILHVRAIGLLYTALKRDVIGGSKRLADRITQTKEIANHALIQEAIKFLKENPTKMNISQKIGFFLLKHNYYILLYVAIYCTKNKG